MSSNDDYRLNERPKYWFTAKSHGWGWTLPFTWQGWVAFGIYLALILVMMFVYPVMTMPNQFVTSVLILSLGLVMVCWIKGEPLR